MVNIREIYDMWKQDPANIIDTKKYLCIVELFIHEYGFCNNNALAQFACDDNIVSSAISNISNNINTNFNLKIDITDDQPYELDSSSISDSLCLIIYVLDEFQASKKYDCVLDISKYMLNEIMTFCIKYNTFAKYYFNTRVVYNIFSGFIDIITKYFNDFSDSYKLDAIENLSKSIIILNDHISKCKDNVALMDLVTTLIDMRDNLYNKVK